MKVVLMLRDGVWLLTSGGGRGDELGADAGNSVGMLTRL